MTATTNTVFQPGAAPFQITGDGSFLFKDEQGTNTILTIGPTGALTTAGALGQVGALTVTSAGASAFAVGRLGATTPALVVDASAATSVTGLKITSAAAASGLALALVGGGAAENLTLNAKGTGTISIASVSTGAVTVGASLTVTGNLSATSSLLLSSGIYYKVSATTPAIANDGTIATANVSVARVTPAGAVTGIIIGAGAADGQQLVVVNNGAGASTLTMATAATSNVADGTACVIAGLTARSFVWDNTAARWFACTD